MELKRTYLAMRLLKARKTIGYTQEEVMTAIGLKSHARISQWERGERVPSYKHLVNLAVLYRVMIDYFFIEARQEAVQRIAPRLETFEIETRRRAKPP